MAGEGNFHAYRLLRSGRRGFLFAKYLIVTLSHGLRRGDATGQKTVVFIKGKNQLRYQSFLAPQLQAEFGDSDVFTASRLPLDPSRRRLAGFSFLSTMRQAVFLALMLATGRRRYLDLYLLEFQAEIDRIVGRSFGNIENFVCLNDQPYDVAAILNTLHSRGNCRTVVVQHGLVLNEKFYFPSVAREFWAWGELSKRHYRSWDQSAKIVVKGRYAGDAAMKRERYLSLPADGRLKILVAPSFFHDEVNEIVTGLKAELSGDHLDKAVVAIKLHPAMKFQGRLTSRLRKQAPWLESETAPIETLAEEYDVLVTKNSTSAIDFLLRGKPVFFHPPNGGADFPSMDYGFPLAHLKLLIEGRQVETNKKNDARRGFLKVALNV